MSEAKVGGRLKQKGGKWYCALYWYDKNGTRQYSDKSTKLPIANNKRKAGEILAKCIHDKEEELSIPESQAAFVDMQNKPFSDYIKLWLESIEGNIDPVTFTTYTRIANCHVIPFFEKGRLTVKDVTFEVLQTFFNEKKKNGSKNKEGGLGSATLKTMRIILNGATTMVYTAHGLFSPMTLVKTPAREQRTPTVYSVEQCNAMLEAFKDDQMLSLVKATLILGLRRSEMLGLKWSAIDFTARTIKICHVVVQACDNTIYRKDKTKTRTSERVYRMPQQIYDLFISIKKQEQDNRLFFGNTYYESDYVFKWPDGRLYRPDWITRTFGKRLEKYGLPKIRFHDLRHSCASVLYSMGMGVREIQEWLGHSSASITLDIYTHLFKDASDRVLACIDSAFPNSGERPAPTSDFDHKLTTI